MDARPPNFATVSAAWRILPIAIIGLHMTPLALTVQRGVPHHSAFVRTTTVPLALDKLPASAFGDWE